MEQDKQPSCKRAVRLGGILYIIPKRSKQLNKRKAQFVFALTVYGNAFYNIIPGPAFTGVLAGACSSLRMMQTTY
ncbi:hypothetical protein [Paenibacillus oleatilyticus]|uniref:Uncharacterized protein n=1 Tax=Paenibacillus oleatilyticus TaxID=2594886 RepID=A0ABV4UYT5_9BACL